MILASQSPRRQQLLQLVLPSFSVQTANVEESGVVAKSPALLAEKLAQAKAYTVSLHNPEEWVLGCDTVVDLKGVPLGKPENEASAVQMLTALSGKTHLVHTGVCIFAPREKNPVSLFVQTTKVTFSTMTQEEILAYVRTGDCFDKAGGYGIQGQMARFIPKIEGCYYNVMGLPVSALYDECKRLGIVEV